jgi:hypothetical protein
MPLVSTPATNRARTLRKRISSLETGIAAIRQPQDSRPISPCRRLLCCYLGRVSLSFHHRSFLRPWLLHRCQTISLVFCKLCYNYILQSSRKQAHVRPPGVSPERISRPMGGLWSPGRATASLLRVGFTVRGHARGVNDDGFLFALPFSIATVLRRLPERVGFVQIGSEKVKGYGHDVGRVLLRGDLAFGRGA